MLQTILSIFILFIVLRILKKHKLLQTVYRLCLILMVLFLVLSIIHYPKETFESAKRGIDTWFNIVLPSLLPFFIGAELLISLGIIHFLGTLFEPIIRPIFNVPGDGSFIFAMSITSGYPMGVKLVTQMRNSHLLSRGEAQRLLSFCSTSGPLFMIGAVAIGMFHNPKLGTLIAISHYIGAILTGMFFRFYGTSCSNQPCLHLKSYIKRMHDQLLNTLKKRNESLGVILSSAVKNTLESLIMIGGFVTLFSVIIELLTLTHTLDMLLILLKNVLGSYLPAPQVCKAFISGLLEMTTGCRLLSEIHGIVPIYQLVFCTFIISFSGFSIHAQAASLISQTDLSTALYIFSKLVHSLLSAIIAFIIGCNFSSSLYTLDTPVFSYDSYPTFSATTFTDRLLFSSELFLVISLAILTSAFLFHGIYSLCHSIKK